MIIAIGIGVLSSLLFLLFLTKIRPNLEISKQIAIDSINTGNEVCKCYVIKVIRLG